MVVPGVAAALICAVAGSKPWASGSGRAADQVTVAAANLDAGQVPAANALALVCLACWGVMLVTRRRVRRVVSVLALLAAIGVGAAVVVGFTSAPRGVRIAYAGLGATSGVDVGRTGWFWITAVAVLVSVVTTLLAVRLVPTWPEMGSRYDAPTASEGAEDGPVPASARRPAAPDEEPSSLDLWKAMDEGHDPTVGP